VYGKSLFRIKTQRSFFAKSKYVGKKQMKLAREIIFIKSMTLNLKRKKYGFLQE